MTVPFPSLHESQNLVLAYLRPKSQKMLSVKNYHRKVAKTLNINASPINILGRKYETAGRSSAKRCPTRASCDYSPAADHSTEGEGG